MSSSAAIATTIFGLAMVATILIGILSARGRDKGLSEWSVSSRGLGVLFIWLLMAGETYTSFSFLGTAGWSYSFGVPILYLVAYLTVGFAVAYVVGPAIWTYASRHGLISIADMAEHRFRSRPVGILVAVIATVFLVPYIQVQIQGMGVVVNAMTYGSVDLRVAAVISFVVAEVFILVSGLRGSAWVSALKDVLVIAAVVFLAVYIPMHYLDGFGDFMHRMVAEKSEWLTFPGHASDGRDAVWFISTLLLNAVTITIFPTTVAGYLSAKNPNALRRNAVLLPWYQLLLFVPMMIGATALFVMPALGNPDLALFSLVTDSLPAPAVAIIGVAGALSAIVPMSVFMLAIGTLWGRTLLGGGNGADPRSRRTGRTPADDVRTKRLSQLVCLIAGLIALAGALFYPNTLVQLSVLSYEGVAQLVPTVLLALFWRRMSKAGAVAGLLTGLAVVIALWATGNDPWHGVNGGIIGLAVNLAVTAAVTFARPAAAGPPGARPAPRTEGNDPAPAATEEAK
ncbi:sodium:solute symporter family protein [Streptomyces purpurogeneiscleroticus]|uniref:sodium:solute symporter family protein n=1 Tax=Streptomyces purpurogeneiscleroticus TaxID=68259 RepID=UPI001CBF9BBC|nr:sodium:solute symporter family protein [Streptomyces purpurogeneiscleroticus]MBZ4014887.1 sodium:solute symporter [Streptomyces purpurogeneiscleroticus]